MKYRRIVIALSILGALAACCSAQGVKFKVLHNFGATGDGSVPYGPLIIDSKGNLYGTTLNGGTCSGDSYGCGTVFELSLRANIWSEKVLYGFTGGNAGSSPWGGLGLGASGALYGTLKGNSNASGGVFELKRSGGNWTNAILYTAGTAIGEGPGIVLDERGNIYGEIGSGKYSLGAIGELSPGSIGWTYTDLYDFCATYCPDGDGPEAPPIWDSNGNLWGAAFAGGIQGTACVFPSGCGVIFEMTPNGDGTWTYNVIHQFASSSTDGQGPYGGLVMDSAGNFYGGTLGGGAYSNGTLFKFSNVGGTWQETILYDFPNCHQGCGVEGTLAIDAAGNLYGTANGGTGSCANTVCGVIFKLAPQLNGTWKYTVLYNLSQTTGGAEPYHGVILDSKGNLYGVTSNFGKYNFGTAFELTP